MKPFLNLATKGWGGALLLLVFMASPTQLALAEGQLPEHWYQLPEDTKPLAPSRLGSKPDSELDLSALLTKTYLSSQEAFEALPEYSSQNPNRWHLGNLSTELGVTTGGLFGILGIRGTANVMLFWSKRPRSFSAFSEASDHLSDSASDSTSDSAVGVTQTIPIQAQISENSTDPNEALRKELEPVVRIAQTRGVRNPAALRRNLLRAALEFQELTRVLDTSPQPKWIVEAFRFDFTIGASGKLMPVTSVPASVGGEARFRFEWHKKANTFSALSPRSKAADSLARWLASMQSCLSTLSTGVFGFRTTSFQFGIGLSADATIGLAKGSTSAIGLIKFVLNPAWRDGVSIARNTMTSDDEMLIIERNPEASHLEYAVTNLIPLQITKEGLQPSTAIYRVKLTAIQKGLTQAIKIANFFANPTHRLKRGSWKVTDIKAAFDLSIGGSLGLVTVGGIGTVGLDFQAI